MTLAIYRPRLKHVKAIFTSPLLMTIDMITAVQDRVYSRNCCTVFDEFLYPTVDEAAAP